MIKSKTSPNPQSGTSTIEILIALVVIIFTTTTVILVIFSNQTVVLDATLTKEALYKVKGILEESRANSKSGFSQVQTFASVDGIYSKGLDVNTVSPCLKMVTSKMNWTSEFLRPQKVNLGTTFIDIPAALALGGDCGGTIPPPGGSTPHPYNLNSIDLTPSGNKASGLDTFQKIVFLSAHGANANWDDLFIYDTRNTTTSTPPVFKFSLNTGPGLNAVDMIHDNAAGDYIIFAANASTSNQFQVVRGPLDFSSPPVLIAEKALLGVDSTGSYPQGVSIFYLNSRVYVGTKETAGPEFHVFDVLDPSNPIELGSKEINHNVNAIHVKDNKAYLATSANDGELIVLDVSNPAISIPFLYEVNVGGTLVNDEDATSIYILDDKIYLGRKNVNTSSEKDFYILKINNSSAPNEIGSKNIDLNGSGTYISGIRVVGSFAFISATDPNSPLTIWNVSNPSDIAFISLFNFSQATVGVDYDSGILFTANETNDALRLIYLAP